MQSRNCKWGKEVQDRELSCHQLMIVGQIDIKIKQELVLVLIQTVRYQRSLTMIQEAHFIFKTNDQTR